MSKQDQQNWNHIFSISQTQVMHFTRLIGNEQGKFKQGIKLWHIPSFIFLTDSTHQDEANKIWFTQFAHS